MLSSELADFLHYNLTPLPSSLAPHPRRHPHLSCLADLAKKFFKSLILQQSIWKTPNQV